MKTSLEKILLVATFRAKDIDSHAGCLKSWSSHPQIDVLALLEENDLALNSERLKGVKQSVDIIHTYKYTCKSHTADTLTKTSPRISEIFEAFETFTGYAYYAYANADIELAPDNKEFMLIKAIRHVTKDERIVFAQRLDYSDTKSDFTAYASGLDFFCMHHNILSSLEVNPIARTFQIGQVGWDYILPLSFPKKLVTFTSTLPIYHKTHVTGNSADWSLTVASLVLSIDSSWLEKHIMQRLVIQASRVVAKKLHAREKPSRLFNIVKAVAAYLTSRIAFYLAIKHFLIADSKSTA